VSVTSTYSVIGMTCEHCVTAVSEEVGRLDGVQSVHVDLRPGDVSVLTVISEAPLLSEAVRDAIDEAGYAVAA